ncbi:hypothetical protein ACFX15_001577 [Malus domestica]
MSGNFRAFLVLGFHKRSLLFPYHFINMSRSSQTPSYLPSRQMRPLQEPARDESRTLVSSGNSSSRFLRLLNDAAVAAEAEAATFFLFFSDW